MASITRSQYREAILAGIQAVTPGTPALQEPMPPEVIERLHRMADEDTEFGTNFCSEPCACPMGRLGYYDEDKGQTTKPWAMPFASAFDHVWIQHVQGNWCEDEDGDVIQVVDDPIDIEKYALRFLAASVDDAPEALSDAAADLYRERYGEDFGVDTFEILAVVNEPR
jgi:hypothetical protein